MHCVRFGGTALAFCSGSEAALYGSGRSNAFGWEDRPGFDVASSMLEDPVGLEIALETWPTLANCTNPRNGESVVVRINDRGPFHGNRVIDLSTAAARTIGLLRSGTGRVSLALLLD